MTGLSTITLLWASLEAAKRLNNYLLLADQDKNKRLRLRIREYNIRHALFNRINELEQKAWKYDQLCK